MLKRRHKIRPQQSSLIHLLPLQPLDKANLKGESGFSRCFEVESEYQGFIRMNHVQIGIKMYNNKEGQGGEVLKAGFLYVTKCLSYVTSRVRFNHQEL